MSMIIQAIKNLSFSLYIYIYILTYKVLMFILNVHHNFLKFMYYA